MMSSIANDTLVDFWVTEYVRDCMLSCFKNFEHNRTEELTALVHGKLTVVTEIIVK